MAERLEDVGGQIGRRLVALKRAFCCQPALDVHRRCADCDTERGADVFQGHGLRSEHMENNGLDRACCAKSGLAAATLCYSLLT
jgi:hypothetical protein